MADADLHPDQLEHLAQAAVRQRNPVVEEVPVLVTVRAGQNLKLGRAGRRSPGSERERTPGHRTLASGIARIEGTPEREVTLLSDSPTL